MAPVKGALPRGLGHGVARELRIQLRQLEPGFMVSLPMPDMPTCKRHQIVAHRVAQGLWGKKLLETSTSTDAKGRLHLNLRRRG